MTRQKNRLKVADELLDRDLTQAQIAARTGLGLATVCRWLQVLLDERHVHVCAFEPHPNGGPDAAVYRRGPRPHKFRPKQRRVPTDLDRVHAYRSRLRASGEWEHRLAIKRARWRADHPRRDALTAALFGGAR
jgi:hypothetical protein